jgi:pimeloyl-ACP methyl ester carboxylesterase
MSEPYVVMPPFLRTMLFYAGDFDLAMPDYDNANLVDTLPRGVFGYGVAAMVGRERTMAQEVTGPVLLIFVEYDTLMPLSLADLEAATYPKASTVTTRVHGIGHDLNLHLTNADQWADIKDWIRQNVGGN